MEDLFAGNPGLAVLIFVAASMVATRLIDAGLKQKLPKWSLPLISLVLGIAGHMSTALLAGSSWKQAIMFGIASGLGGAGLYSVGAKKLPGMKASSR